MNKKINKMLLGAGAFFVGLVVGVLWSDIPCLSLNKELELGELVNAFATCAVAFSIPFTVNKITEQQKSKKQYILNSIEKLEIWHDDICKYVRTLKVSSVLSTEQKQKLTDLSIEFEYKYENTKNVIITIYSDKELSGILDELCDDIMNFGREASDIKTGVFQEEAKKRMFKFLKFSEDKILTLKLKIVEF